MKIKILLMMIAIAAMGTMSVAQTAGQPTKPQPNSQPSQQTTPAPGQAGAAQAGTGQAPQQPAAVPGTKQPPQAKSQEEFKAFQDANAKTTPADEEAAADAFAKAHPDSELSLLLYRKAMYSYQNANNADKAIEMGRKMLAKDPNNPEALVMVATFLAERTRETDLDRDERLAEASRDANKALETVNTDLMLPPTMTPEQVEGVRNQMKGMAYAALGTSAIAKKDYAEAEKNLKQAAQLYPGDPLVWLRLAFALDKENKYAEAITPADNCIQYATEQPQVSNLCKQEKERLTKLAQAPKSATPPPTSPQPQSIPPQ